jgi:cell division protein FtsQ
VALLALAAAGVVAAAGWVLFGSSLLAVRSVTVSGTHLVPQSEVLAVSGVVPGTPLIRVNTAQAAARIERITQVSSAQVTRSWPNRLVIVVRERTPVLVLPAYGGAGYDLADADGVVLKQVARRPADLPLYPTVAPEGALRGNPDLVAAAAVLDQLPGQVRRSVISVTAPAPDQVTLRLAGGITVLWGDAGRAVVKARELTVLMRAHLHYYDVSGPGSVAAR